MKYNWLMLVLALTILVLSACSARPASGATAVPGAIPKQGPTAALGSAPTQTSVTPAPANTPAAPTAVANSSVLFQDDFSNPNSGWVAEKTDYGQFAYTDGEFRILLNKADFNTYALLPARDFDNISVEVDARLADGPQDGVFGLMCRVAANAGTASQAYVFAMRADGVYAILKRTSPTFWDALVSGKQSTAIKTGNATNHLRADCSGDNLVFYANGQKLLETSDTDFKSGQVGLAVTTQPNSQAMDVYFDNFVVSVIGK
jgi:hypothetical protein